VVSGLLSHGRGGGSGKREMLGGSDFMRGHHVSGGPTVKTANSDPPLVKGRMSRGSDMDCAP
jgi:hypothetical protein